MGDRDSNNTRVLHWRKNTTPRTSYSNPVAELDVMVADQDNDDDNDEDDDNEFVREVNVDKEIVANTSFQESSRESEGSEVDLDDDKFLGQDGEIDSYDLTNRTGIKDDEKGKGKMFEIRGLDALCYVGNLLLKAEEETNREKRKTKALFEARKRAISRRDDLRRVVESAINYAHGYNESTKSPPDEKSVVEDTTSLFAVALKKIMAQSCSETLEWKPARDQERVLLKTHVPSLVDLAIDELGKNVDALVSLDCVPEPFKHKLSKAACDSGKMNAKFLRLLMSGSPTELRVCNCSYFTENEFLEILGGLDTKELKVLQLDLSGRCFTNHLLTNALARSISFPSLATISLRGVCGLSDVGVRTLTVLAPFLHSINLSQSTLLTAADIDILADSYSQILKELYIDDCQKIDAMESLSALQKLKHLEVLSVSGIFTVSDAFVAELVSALGKNMKKLVLAQCRNLTDSSVQMIGNGCKSLRMIDLSYLPKLTDSSIRYLANGCRKIQVLKLSRDGFSDEAIAAFLEVSGSNLIDLSLNYVTKVGPKTALSLSKYSTSLVSLDLSWCRKFTDEALGLIVDCCLSLRLLKLFGCSQITEVLLKGVSNSSAQIVGLYHVPLFKHLPTPQYEELQS